VAGTKGADHPGAQGVGQGQRGGGGDLDSRPCQGREDHPAVTRRGTALDQPGIGETVGDLRGAGVRGTCTEVSGQGEVLADGSAGGSLTIGAASVDTGNARRDTHLRSADFFDADRNPSIVFTALRITPGADGTAEVNGDLTARGLTRPLTFSARVTEDTTGAVTLAAEVIIDRGRYAMTWNKLGMITGQATIAVTACFTREQP
jgi:polyisoprenoid-binding protein YceI